MHWRVHLLDPNCWATYIPVQVQPFIYCVTLSQSLKLGALFSSLLGLVIEKTIFFSLLTCHYMHVSYKACSVPVRIIIIAFIFAPFTFKFELRAKENFLFKK